MFVIVGLGNPGRKYEKTRHNIGFLAIDKLAKIHDIMVNKLKHKALLGDGIISDQKVLLVKPQTYMNMSGESVREIIGYYDIDLKDLIVIYDDFDLDIGVIRIRKKGSAGNHNGMKSIIDQIRSKDFPRIRIGIGKISSSAEWKDFVLSKTSKQDEKLLKDTVECAANAVECIIEKGIDKAMNGYNVKSELSKMKERDIEKNFSKKIHI